MASGVRLDRKARIAVTVAVILLLAGPVVVALRYTAAKLNPSSEQAFHPTTHDVVTLPDGSTMLVKHGSVSHRIVDWLDRKTKGEKSIDVGNANFAAGSSKLTHDGWEHVVQFASVLKAYHNVKGIILFSPYHGEQGSLPLEHARAERIHDELLNQGAAEEQITVAPEAFGAEQKPSDEAGLRVVLVNRAESNR